MSDLISESESFLEDRMVACASSTVLYTHISTTSSESVSASVGRTMFSAISESGVSVKYRTTDFLIRSSSMSGEPKKGDLIQYRGKTFEVYAPENEPCWRYSGGNHSTYRIHTHETFQVVQNE